MTITELMLHFEEMLSLDSQQAQDRYLAQLATVDPQTSEELQRLLHAHRVSEALQGSQGFRPVVATSYDDLGLPGCFCVKRRLGEGGMSTVYLAEEQGPLKRLVAIKIMLALFSSERFTDRFQSEFQTLVKLDSPHVAKVYDTGLTSYGRPYFVMEYISGRPITDYCDEHQLTIDARVTLVAQVCKALQTIHSQGIIHRDVKPHNILVKDHLAEDALKIIDFGVAKVYERDSTQLNVLTCVGDLMGTPAYMSPEQAEGRPDIDTRTDVYSVGAVLYELLAGSPPIVGSNLESFGLFRVIERIKHDNPQRPSVRVAVDARLESLARARSHDKLQLIRTLSGDLDRIVHKALAKDRVDRYQSAAAMAVDLDNYLARRPVLATEPPLARRTVKLIRKHKQILLVAAFCSLLAMSATLIAVSRWFPTRETVGIPASFQRFQCMEDEPVKISVLRESQVRDYAWIVTAVNCMPITTDQRVAVAGGTVVLAQCGNLLFTPEMDKSGPVAFTYTLADQLGHQIQGAVHGDVTAVADRPTVYWQPESPNFVQNGQFKELSGDENPGFVFRKVVLPGWEQTEGLGLEARPAFPPGKGYSIKLDVGSNSVVAQRIQGLEAGRAYLLTFDCAAWDNSATVQLLWGGELLKTLSPASRGGFSTHNLVIEGGTGNGSDRLEFREIGTPDHRGTWLSNVRVWANHELTVVASTDEVVRLPPINAEVTDTDGSESVQIILANLPRGLMLSDGVHCYYETEDRFQDITEWNRENLWLTAPANTFVPQDLELIVTSTESSNGQQAVERRMIHLVSN